MSGLCLAKLLVFRGYSHCHRFLESWKAGDYPSAFDNLHRYFDYTLRSGDRSLYQYALLNMATTYADSGCLSEVVSTIQETIAAARESKDLKCLHYSLVWLLNLGYTHPKCLLEYGGREITGDEKETLVFLGSKAKEMHVSSLLSAYLLSDAGLLLSRVGTLLKAFD